MSTKCLHIALLFLIIAGCDRALERDKVVELRFWNGFTGPDGRTMLAIVKRFNEANPDVRVTMQRMEWGTYYNKLFVAGLGGRAPEVFVIHTDTLARFIRANFVRPLDDFTGEGGIDAGDFDENVWSAVEHDGQHYAIPLDIHLLGMYYNRALFRQAGIEKPPATRDEFLDALHKVKALNQRDTWGYVFTWQRTNLYTMCRQNGGTIFDDELSAPALTSEANLEALRFARGLIEQKLAPAPQDFESWIGFRQGRVAMVFDGIYMLPDLLRQKDLDYAAAPLPVLFDQPAAWANSHNLCVRADVEGARLEAVKRFVKYLSDNSLDWAEGGQIPVRKSLRESERFQQMPAQREFARQIPYAQYMPTVPFVFEYLSQYELALDKTLRGVASPREAMEFAEQRIAPVIARYRAADSALAEARP